eukprot:10925657-Ditylum_brightwellii.AAC.1
MRHYPVTTKGVSNKCNRHEDKKPVFGLGQGATESPAKWNVANNANLVHNLNKLFNLSSLALVAIVQYDATLWGQYLWTSGGWLEYMKMQFCMLIWVFKKYDKPYLLSDQELPENKIIIKGVDGSNTKLKRLEVHKGTKMLGVHHAGALQQNTEFQHLKGKVIKFACAIVAAPLQRNPVKR